MKHRRKRRPTLLVLGFVAALAVGAVIVWLIVPPDDDDVAAADMGVPVETPKSAGTTEPTTTTSTTTTTAATRTTTVTSTTTTTTTTLPPRRATMSFTGDLLPHRPVVRAAAARSAEGWDFLPMFEEVTPIISRADLAICHLETPLSLDGTGLSGYPTFNAPRALAEATRDAGYDGCSTASNHAYDQGAAGIEATVQVMEEVGLAQAGMATSDLLDIAPVLHDVNGITVAHISATYGLNGFRMPADRPYLVDLIEPPDIIAEARLARESGAEFVVVSLHWGTEYRSEPNDAQVAWLDQILPKAEIDLVIGHHAHVVQPVDKVGAEWAVFGLGNFLSNQSASCCSAATQDGMIATVEILETSPGVIEVSGVSYTPTWVDRGAGHVIRVAGDRSDSGLPASTNAALAASYERTVSVVGSRLGEADGLTVGLPADDPSRLSALPSS